MHYANGRIAKNGDKVILFPQYSSPVLGILYDAQASNNNCNGKLAPCSPSDLMPDLKSCIHYDDVEHLFAGKAIPDSSPAPAPTPKSSGRSVPKLLAMIDDLGDDEASLKVHGLADHKARLREVRVLIGEVRAALSPLKEAEPSQYDKDAVVAAFAKVEACRKFFGELVKGRGVNIKEGDKLCAILNDPEWRPTIEVPPPNTPKPTAS